MTNWAMPITHVETLSNGMKYYRFEWIGGRDLSITDEFIEDCDPAYASFGEKWGYFGPWKLQRIGHQSEWNTTSWYCDFGSLYNRIVPKIYPIYVRWIEFWRWIVKYWSIQ